MGKLKVLVSVWTVINENIPETAAVNPNGGSIAINDMVEAMSHHMDVYLFMAGKPVKERMAGNIHVLDSSAAYEGIGYEPGMLLRNYPEIDRKRNENLVSLIQKHVKEINPDIINVQGGGRFDMTVIPIFLQQGRKVVYTDHLYTPEKYKDSSVGSPMTFDFQEKVLPLPNLHAICISSGEKKMMLEDFPELGERIHVIVNGIRPPKTDYVNEIRKKYGIIDERPVLVCSGSICMRKNQLQLVRAVELLPPKVRERLQVIFCGIKALGLTEWDLSEEIEKRQLEDAVKYIGLLPADKVGSLYALADGIISVSLNEGLSLVMLESATLGKPQIMFRDSECAMDMDDDRVTEFITDHTDQAVADAIVRWYEKDWDNDYIRRFAEQFSLERVGKQYRDLFEELTDI